MSSSIDETELQKLIDGELDLPATKSLLKSAETNSDQWRQIATAFVEDRLWQQSFQQLDSNSSAIAPPVPETAAKSIPDQTQRNAGSPSWLALAAGLLLAAGVGFYAGTGGSMVSDADAVPQSTAAVYNRFTAPDGLPPTDDANPTDLAPEYELELTDAMGIGKSSVPIYSARRLNQLPVSQRNAFVAAGPSDQEIQRLQQSGYQLRQNTDYLSGRLKDGRTFVVPVRTINVSSGQ